MQVIVERLQKDEGNGLPGKPFQLYKDSKGYWTIGWGFCIDPALGLKIPAPVADFWLNYLINQVEAELQGVRWFEDLDPVRQNLIVCLAYNLGEGGILKFVKMIAALQAKDYNRAADELENSSWFGQVGVRGPIYVRILRTGTWE